MVNRSWLLMALAGILAGCASQSDTRYEFAPLVNFSGSITNRISGSITNKTAGGQVIITPVQKLTGRISSANPSLQFVVITFPVGQMAEIGQRLFVYRGGLRVGELKVTGPQSEDSIVADIVAGEARKGDDVFE
ncbi:MAG TPA: hypothetical protein GYA07_06115 [Verrucomicrobia bacterium]|nr:hypothetical protein [Verrucomicrobiota bacterium]HOP98689.1 hypothetical protein [Verrucomicrobiota bacterium]